MCAERMRSIIIAIVLGITMGLVGSGSLQYAFIVQLLLIIALLVDGTTGYCPLRFTLRAILPPCNDKEGN